MSSIKAKRKKTIKSTKKEKKPRVSPKSGETELELPVYDVSGKEVSSVKLAPEIFNVKMNHNLIYQVATSQMANRRKVIAHTKDRSEVRGGGRKPWRQKGTGRARHGSIRSPLWRGGGVTFGPTKARVFKKEIPKKMRRLAFFMVISAKAQNSLLILLDKLKVDELRSSSPFANARVIETPELSNELNNLLNELLLKSEIETAGLEINEECKDCLREIKSLEVKNKLNEISKEIKKAEELHESEKLDKLLQEFNQCSKSLCDFEQISHEKKES